MKESIVAFLKDEGGQTSTEYILLVAVVAMIVIKFGGTLKTKLLDMSTAVFDKAEKDIMGFDGG